MKISNETVKREVKRELLEVLRRRGGPVPLRDLVRIFVSMSITLIETMYELEVSRQIQIKEGALWLLNPKK